MYRQLTSVGLTPPGALLLESNKSVVLFPLKNWPKKQTKSENQDKNGLKTGRSLCGHHGPVSAAAAGWPGPHLWLIAGFCDRGLEQQQQRPAGGKK